MIYAIDGLNIYEILSILIEKTERSDTTNLQYSIVNIQFGSGLSGLGYNLVSRLINFVFHNGKMTL